MERVKASVSSLVVRRVRLGCSENPMWTMSWRQSVHGRMAEVVALDSVCRRRVATMRNLGLKEVHN
jgi:hypothetical protein